MPMRQRALTKVLLHCCRLSHCSDPWKTVMMRGTLSGGVHGSGLSLAETVFSSDYVTHTHSIALSDRTFLLSYYDGGNSDAGTAVAGESLAACATDIQPAAPTPATYLVAAA